VSRPTTEADPIVTRVSLCRSSDGSPFGQFLQVFADGTVLDGDGAHRVGRDALKPVLDALQASELYRLKGHCGGPPTDYVEQVHVIVYDRSLGRLRAGAFSYSGNPQGCDHAVRQLHAALDALQARINRPPASPPMTLAPTAVAPPPPPVAASTPPVYAAPLPPGGIPATSIPLTTPDN
jgi:hypothetical protein